MGKTTKKAEECEAVMREIYKYNFHIKSKKTSTKVMYLLTFVDVFFILYLFLNR